MIGDGETCPIAIAVWHSRTVLGRARPPPLALAARKGVGSSNAGRPACGPGAGRAARLPEERDMYSFEPSEEQRMLVDAAQRYAINDLRKAAHDADEAGELPQALINKGWELGVLQASIPEAYGGFGEHSARDRRAGGRGAGLGATWPAALAVMAPGLYALPILLAGTEEQKKALLPPVVEGDWKPYARRVRRAHLRLLRRRDADHGRTRTGRVRPRPARRLRALRRSGARRAGRYAALDGRPQAFVVPPQGAGREGRRAREAAGPARAADLQRLKLDGVRLPADARLGGPDGHDPRRCWPPRRWPLAALAVGISRAAYEYALNYAKEREVFGVPIAQKQAIAFMLAEMATEIEAIRLLVWEAAWTAGQGKDASKAAYLALTGALRT